MGGHRMSVNPLVELTKSGQSIWYDGIERGLVTSGELKRLIDEDELPRSHLNTTIFEKAIAFRRLLWAVCGVAERERAQREFEALAGGIF